MTPDAYGLRRSDFHRVLSDDETIGAGNFLFRYAEHAADGEAVVLESDIDSILFGRNRGRQIRLGDLVGMADALARWYAARGIVSKDPVAVFVDDTLEYYVHFAALTRIGAIPTFVNSSMDRATAQAFVRHVRAIALVADRERLDAMRPGLAAADSPPALYDAGEIDLDHELPPVRPYEHGPRDPVLIAHTSGTTGRPKAVQFNHAGFFFGVRQQLGRDFGERALSALPHSHGSAIAMLMSCVMRGIPVLVHSSKEPESVLASIERYRPNTIFGFAKVFVDLCRCDLDAYDLSSVARWLSTGDASHEPHIRRLVQYGTHMRDGALCNGSMFLDNLGSSEFAFAMLRNVHAPDTDCYDRCIGKPFRWVEVEVFDDQGDPVPPNVVGRLGVKAPSVTAGYWNDSVMTEKSRIRGYWLTGDLVYRDEQGRYFHVDRTPDKISSAKRDVYSCQTEELIMKHFPEVFDCTVVGIDAGGSVGLAVTAELTDPATDVERLRRRIGDFLMTSGLPDVVRLVPVDRGWQEGVTGKKLKRTIRTVVAAD
jgi:acyl-coenzyme A synthetase/AMP-(fatty) acid ligase